jgi:hypothetical protein
MVGTVDDRLPLPVKETLTTHIVPLEPQIGLWLVCVRFVVDGLAENTEFCEGSDEVHLSHQYPCLHVRIPHNFIYD